MALHFILALGLEPTLAAFGWMAVLTYLLHGAIWAGAAACLVRLRAFSASAQSYLWLAALIGPLVTSAVATTASSSREYVREVEVRQLAAVSAEYDGSPRSTEGLGPSVLIALVAASALGVFRFALALSRLKRRLRDRVPVDDPRILARLERLRSRIDFPRVTLTQSAAIDVPLVLGRAEICLPLGSASAASAAEIDAVLAHELVHLARRDGVVFPVVGFVQSIGWWQPLHHWLASRFRHAAELACDDRAVELTGDRSALAHALARVARDAIGASREPMLPAMARPRAASALVVRIRRLLSVQQRTTGRAGALWAAVCGMAIAVATVSVSVRAAREPQLAAPATVAAATEQIAGWLLRAEQLEQEIGALQRSAADRESEPRLLELQQQLRHARENAAWIERESSGRARP